MKKEELYEGIKVVDIVQENGKRLDGQILEYHKDKYGEEYLCSEKSMWNLTQFDLNQYEVYHGALAVGQFIGK